MQEPASVQPKRSHLKWTVPCTVRQKSCLPHYTSQTNPFLALPKIPHRHKITLSLRYTPKQVSLSLAVTRDHTPFSPLLPHPVLQSLDSQHRSNTHVWEHQWEQCCVNTPIRTHIGPSGGSDQYQQRPVHAEMVVTMSATLTLVTYGHSSPPLRSTTLSHLLRSLTLEILWRRGCWFKTRGSVLSQKGSSRAYRRAISNLIL